MHESLTFGRNVALVLNVVFVREVGCNAIHVYGGILGVCSIAALDDYLGWLARESGIAVYANLRGWRLILLVNILIWLRRIFDHRFGGLSRTVRYKPKQSVLS